MSFKIYNFHFKLFVKDFLHLYFHMTKLFKLLKSYLTSCKYLKSYPFC